MTPTKNYTPNDINFLAAPADAHGNRVTELLLEDGDTAWNPASTKGPLVGPSVLVYDQHVSGIRIFEMPVGTCVAPFWPEDGPCPNPAVDRETRCADHLQT